MGSNKITLRGEICLALAVVMNSIAVLLMLRSGSGISAISSVPYAFHEVLPDLTLGTWTYIFQGILVCVLMVARKQFVPSYLFSFVVGFCFGKMMDIEQPFINALPLDLGYRVFYFCLSYCLLCIGIALENRCKLPITPTDLFPREMSQILHIQYSKFKISFDVSCLLVTAILTFGCLHHIEGLGIGTIVSACTMGKGIALAGSRIDLKFNFESIQERFA